MSNPRAWLTPSAILPLGTACYTIAVPDDEGFRRILVGALGLLNRPENYEQFGTLSPEDTAKQFQQTIDSFIFRESVCGMIGSIIPYVTNSPPPKMLPCDGTTYNRVDYPRLYVALAGTPLILDVDTFQTPLLEGRFLRGATITNAVNSVGGSDEKTIGINNLPAHSHTYEGVIPNIDLELAGVPDVFGAGINPIPEFTSSVGGGVPMDIKPSFYTVNYGIVWG